VRGGQFRRCQPDECAQAFWASCHGLVPIRTFPDQKWLDVSLNRILEGRPKLKFFEAGMDLRLSADPYESFKIFQGRILDQFAERRGDRAWQTAITQQGLETLRRLRSLSNADGAEAKALREVMAITINGIAAGLRNTG